MLESHYSFSYIFKFVIIGETGVGKSCLLRQFTEKKFMASCQHTIGIDFFTKIVQVGNTRIKLQIWDTAGQERFHAITTLHYRGAAACFLVYDVTRRSSFNNLNLWLHDIRNLLDSASVICLIGNKRELESSREVSYQEAKKFAIENGLNFMETSAMTGQNVENAFIETSTTVYQKIKEGKLNLYRIDSGISEKRLRAIRKSKMCSC